MRMQIFLQKKVETQFLQKKDFRKRYKFTELWKFFVKKKSSGKVFLTEYKQAKKHSIENLLSKNNEKIQKTERKIQQVMQEKTFWEKKRFSFVFSII